VESIRSLGLQDPPLVRRLDDGSLVILAGHRRVRSWQLLAERGEVGERIPVYARSDITDRDAVYIIAAEYAHRRDYSVVHTARIVGTAVEARREELGQKPTAREMADLLPWGKSSIAAYQAIHAALQDPEIEALVHSVDRPGKSLLHRVLSHKDLSREALEAYRDGGAAAARSVLKRGRTGRPSKVVSKRKDGARSAVTVRYRAGMTPGDAEKVLQALRETVVEVEGMMEQESCGTERPSNGAHLIIDSSIAPGSARSRFTVAGDARNSRDAASILVVILLRLPPPELARPRPLLLLAHMACSILGQSPRPGRALQSARTRRAAPLPPQRAG